MLGTPIPSKTKIVAEIGVNWNSVDEAKQMIELAAKAGVTHVKFQAYDLKTIEHLSDQTYKHLLHNILTKEIANELKECAVKNNVEWFATPTSVARVDFLEEIGVSTYKIREKDSGNQELLKKVRSLNKPMFVSSQHLPPIMELLYDPMITWMWCVPRYPPLLEDLELSEHIPAFRGYSNHFPHITAPFVAKVLGARVIECHVTLSHDRLEDLDAAVSIDFTELRLLCEMISIFEEMSRPKVSEYELA